MAFKGISDDAGRARICFMPAEINKVQVAETESIIDWAAEEREPLLAASVEVTPLKDNATPIALAHIGSGDFVAPDGGLPDGCVSILIQCPGYEQEERTVMLLVGANDFYVPLKRV